MKKKIFYLLMILVICLLLILGINFYIINKTKSRIITNYNLDNIDCVIVLGAGVKDDTPSPMLKDRLDKTLTIYNNYPYTIVVSADNEKKDYDEVSVMKNYLINNGIDSKEIFIDKAGISTYDSIYRIKNVYNAKKILIVSQSYHLYRALYIADSLDLNAYGVSAQNMKYKGQIYREIREILARNKDFVKTKIKAKSKYSSKEVNITNE